ncbi:MAG: hypothetical protein K2K21_16015 [Lachnospiraceae bacterium]|nr:hypothetical protein [Lachnospiraceae bacterium]
MDDLTRVVSKEKLALLNKEVEILEKERDDLLYNYRLLKDKIHHLKRRTIPRLLVIGVYLIINRVIRIRQLAEMRKHTPGESWGSPPPTMADHIRDFLTHQDLLFYLFIILSIYSIFLGMRLYAMCSKTEHSIMPLKIADIMNVHNYGMELTDIEVKIRRCDQELRRIKMEADHLFLDTIDQPPR